jgi:hypothetical protein
LAPAREAAPSRFRVRFPDLYVQQKQTGVHAPVNEVRRDVGLGLDTDHELARAYRTRDRLYPATIAAHVETLRASVRRWLIPVLP